MGIIELDGLEVRLGGRAVLNGLTGDYRGASSACSDLTGGEVFADQHVTWFL